MTEDTLIGAASVALLAIAACILVLVTLSLSGGI